MKKLNLLAIALLGVTVVLAGCNSSEKKYDENSWKEVISSDCTHFFDGCNDCSRVEGEEGAACTRKYCETYEEPRCTDNEVEEENNEVTYNEDSWKEIITDDCVNFYDGCNYCTRLEGEEGAACTRKYCETYEEPRCTDNEGLGDIIDDEFAALIDENGEVLDGTEMDRIMVDAENNGEEIADETTEENE